MILIYILLCSCCAWTAPFGLVARSEGVGTENSIYFSNFGAQPSHILIVTLSYRIICVRLGMCALRKFFVMVKVWNYFCWFLDVALFGCTRKVITRILLIATYTILDSIHIFNALYLDASRMCTKSILFHIFVASLYDFSFVWKCYFRYDGNSWLY